ncbi:MAG: NUDIX domain-containing protein [Candidatus Berkelbacteria bacterium]
MKIIHKIIAISIKNDSFIMVRKKGKDIWTNLGGKPEIGETEKVALAREVNEEIGCDINIIKKLRDFESKAIFDDAIVKLSAFLVEIIGEPVIQDDELEEFAYISSDYKEKGIKLPPSITEQIIPFLIDNGYLSKKF